MVRCTEVMRARLGDIGKQGRRIFSAPHAGWATRSWHLGFFLARTGTAEQVVGIGLVHPGRRIGDYERGLNVDAVTILASPLPREQLENAPSLKGYARALDENGPLTDEMGDRLRAALIHAQPDLEEAINALATRLTTEVSGSAGELLSWQKDGLAIALQSAGMERDVLREYAPPAAGVPQPPFVAGLPIEEQHLAHDYSVFVDWVPHNHREAGWRSFTKGGQRLWVYMSNRRALETQLGMDLIYYHQNHGNFVLLQYKRMLPDHREGWSYRPNEDIAKQLQRMKAIDDECAKISNDPLRLVGTPSMVKLCKTELVNNDSTELIKGMYLTRGQFSHLLDICKGPRGGTLLTYGNVPRYLNNTTFTDLLRDGWIGTSGVASDYVKRRIEEIEGTDRPLVVAVRRTAN